MRIFITGSKGQLGTELTETFLRETDHIVEGHDRDTLDITDYSAVLNDISAFKPDVVINGAAYTNVDGCETDYINANAVNCIGAMYVARAAEAVGAKLVHISTDFVFDGKKDSPYFEYDATNPLSVYGKTKLSGEQAVRNECKKHFIVRTSWLYGKYGNNFVKTMIKLGKQNDSISVVTDQIGSPTYVTDLIQMLLKMIHTDIYGTFHFSNTGVCSWNGFAKEIFRLSGLSVDVKDTTAKEFVRPAARPSYSVMDTSLVQASMNYEIRSWQSALEAFLDDEKSSLMAL